MLDWIVDEVGRLRRSLGPVDRVALDDYLAYIREIERRIELVEQRNMSGEEREMPEAPSGIPEEPPIPSDTRSEKVEPPTK